MQKGGEKKSHKWFARIGQSGAYKYFYSQAELAAYKARQAGSAIKNKLDKNKDGHITPFKKTVRPEDDPTKNGQYARKRYSTKKNGVEYGFEHARKAHQISKNLDEYKKHGSDQAQSARERRQRQQRKQAEVKEKINKIAAGYDKKKDLEKEHKDVRADKMFRKDFDGEPVSLSELAERIRRNRQDRFYAEKKYRKGYRGAMTIEGLRGAFVKSPAGFINPDVYRVVKKDTIGTNGYEPAKNSTKIKKKSNRDQSSLATQQEQLERFNTEMMQESERLNREQIQEQQRQQEIIDNNMMNMMLFSKNNRKRLKYKNSSKA